MAWSTPAYTAGKRNSEYRKEIQNLANDLMNLEGKLEKSQFEGKNDESILLELLSKWASLLAVIEARV
ncbi:hypothetical protein NDU88_003825 [Pleurodeles waltl]|uniref:Uncharacterized protein n=1 Tax=Pleurodeles waltl TaxID=8319 RepID=A0AAV7NQT1_PLEWA|nr:hypothetical protein NDU88_003825 [Pleurodeles waltl]